MLLKPAGLCRVFWAASWGWPREKPAPTLAFAPSPLKPGSHTSGREMGSPRHSEVRWWRGSCLLLGPPGQLLGKEGDSPPPGGAPFARIWGWKKEGYRSPRCFLGLGCPRAGKAGRSRRGRGAIRGTGPPGCGLRARRLPAARHGAPARRALHSPSLHQRLREEGREPSLAHFPPSQTRTLPRSRSLTPSLSRSHTHTRAPAAAAPSLAPALPPAPPGSRRAPDSSSRAGSPAPRSVPRRQGWGEPRAAPRGKSAGAAGGWPARVRGEAAQPGGSPPAGGSGPEGARGPSLQPQAEPGCPRPAPRAPSSRRGGRGGSFPRPNFPRRGAEPPLGPESAALPVPQPRPPRAPEPPGPPRAAGRQRQGAEPARRKALGRWRASRRGPGPRRSRLSPHPRCQGSAPGPLPEAGSGAGKYRPAVSVCARVCVREVVRVRGYPGAGSSRGDTHGCGHLARRGSWPTGTPAASPARPRCPRAVGPARGHTVSQRQSCRLSWDRAAGALSLWKNRA